MRFFRTFRVAGWHGPLWACARASSLASVLCCAAPLAAQSIPLPARNASPATPAQNGPPLAPPAKNAPKPADAEPAVSEAPVIEISVRFVETRPIEAQPAATEADRVAEQLGRLVFARIDLEAERAPLREVLRKLRKALGVNLVVFEQQVQGGSITSGIDGDQLIDIGLDDIDGYGVLDTLAGLAAGDCTWQINRGIIEFGPKSHLARVDARRTEVVDVGDLALIPPDYEGQLGKLNIQSYNRLDSDEVLADLIRGISTHCEPSAFEPDTERKHDPYPTGNRQIVPVNPEPGKTRVRVNPSTNAWRNLDPRVGPVYIHGKWASIQTKDLALMLVAPDFVMRKIIGYPKPLPPRIAAEEVVPPRMVPATQESAPAKPAAGHGK